MAGLNDAICLTDSFVFITGHYVTFKATVWQPNPKNQGDRKTAYRQGF